MEMPRSAYLQRTLQFVVQVSVFYVAVGQVSTPPSATTAAVGDSPVFVCTYTGTNPFEWREYITTEEGVSIFQKPPDNQPESSKYSIEGTYNLVVNDVNLWDGGFYGCKEFSMSTFAKADLVVLERPEMFLPDLVEGNKVEVTCNARYGGPAETTGEQHHPSMRVYLDNVLLNQVLVDRPGKPGNEANYEPGLMSVAFNHTPTNEDQDKNLTCQLFTQNPEFSVAMTTILNVKYPVRNIALHPIQSSYHVTEQINCTAEGNPAPDFEWRPISSPGSNIYPGPIFTIQPNMVGQNEWRCIATNSVEGSQAMEQIIEFEVLSGAPPGGDATVTNPSATFLYVNVLVCMSAFS